MPNTSRLLLPYPSLSDAPNGPQQIQDLAAALDANLAGTFARKTVFTDRAPTVTLADDPELTVAVAANAVYEVLCTLLVHSSSPSGGDFNMKFTGPSGAALAATATGYTTTATTNTGVVATGISLTTTASFGIGIATADPWNPVAIQGTLVTAGASGAFTLQWAQASSSATITRLMNNSALSLRRVA